MTFQIGQIKWNGGSILDEMNDKHPKYIYIYIYIYTGLIFIIGIPNTVSKKNKARGERKKNLELKPTVFKGV